MTGVLLNTLNRLKADIFNNKEYVLFAILLPSEHRDHPYGITPQNKLIGKSLFKLEDSRRFAEDVECLRYTIRHI